MPRDEKPKPEYAFDESDLPYSQAPSAEWLAARDQDYIVGGVLVPGGVNILSGPTHAGKSTFIAYMLRCIRRGEPLFGVKTRAPKAVGVIALDHRWLVYEHLYAKIGWPDVPHYALKDDEEPKAVGRMMKVAQESPGLAFEWLLEKLWGAQVPEDSLVVVDPIHQLTGKDINDYAKVAAVMTELGYVCRRKGVTLIGAAHAAKISGDPTKRYVRAIDKAAGSTALVGYSETLFNISVPEENGEGCYQFNCFPRLCAPFTFRLDRDENGMFRRVRRVDDGLLEMPCYGLVQLFEPGEQVGTAEAIGRATNLLGVSKRTAQRYLGELREKGLLVQVSYGVYQAVRES